MHPCDLHGAVSCSFRRDSPGSCRCAGGKGMQCRSKPHRRRHTPGGTRSAKLSNAHGAGECRRPAMMSSSRATASFSKLHTWTGRTPLLLAPITSRAYSGVPIPQYEVELVTTRWPSKMASPNNDLARATLSGPQANASRRPSQHSAKIHVKHTQKARCHEGTDAMKARIA